MIDTLMLSSWLGWLLWPLEKLQKRRTEAVMRRYFGLSEDEIRELNR